MANNNTSTIPSAPVTPPLAAPPVQNAGPLPPLTFTPAGVTPEMLQAMQYEELQLRLLQMREERGKIEAKRLQLEAQKRQGRIVITQQKAEERRQQASCSHLKENGKTYAVGQYDHHGNLNTHCQACHINWYEGPDWTNDAQYDTNENPNAVHPRGLKYAPKMPQHLRPPAEWVGGPTR